MLFFTPLLSLQILCLWTQFRLKEPLTKNVVLTIRGHCREGKEKALSR